MDTHDTAALCAVISNAAWQVRYWQRNAERHAQAVQLMGATVRQAFNQSNDYAPLLRAVVDGLANVPDPRFAV